MKGLLIAVLCAAPLVAGYGAYEPAQSAPRAEAVETAFQTSMGCGLSGCTDPAHFHWCAPDCGEVSHYHDCPVGCDDPTHPHCNQRWEPSAEAGPEWSCPREDCPREDCPREDCPREDCPVEDWSRQGCPRGLRPGFKGRCGGGWGHHGGWHH